MHMADALISPEVGIAMWAAAAGAAAYSIKKVSPELDDKKVPLMGVMGAFIFATQMINFSIPGTGSSGHLAGGVLLAALLGPYAGFLTLLSVVLVQALFFADGGLLALGANVFNMGFYACFIAYPLIMRLILKKGTSARRIFWGSMLTSVAALQMGAFSVVLQTLLSGKTELPFATFVSLMQPIHLAIGVVEGLVTAAIVSFVWKARPDIVEGVMLKRRVEKKPIAKVVIVLAAAAIVVGGFVSWFASSDPDGLEWSMLNTAGQEELAAPDGVHSVIAETQDSIAFLPDYGFKEQDAAEGGEGTAVSDNAGTSVAGVAGAGITLGLAALIGVILYSARKRKKRQV